MRENLIPKWVYLDSRKLAQIANSDPHSPSLSRFLMLEFIEWALFFLLIFIFYSFISSFWEFVCSMITSSGLWIARLVEYVFDFMRLAFGGVS